MLHSFSFSGMPKLLVGAGQTDSLASSVCAFGRRVLLITGAGSLARSGHLERILRHLHHGQANVHHCRIRQEPSPAAVDEIVTLHRENRIQVVLAVGGGSVIDAGKAVAAMLMEDGGVTDFLEGVGTRKPSGRSLPVVAVPLNSF